MEFWGPTVQQESQHQGSTRFRGEEGSGSSLHRDTSVWARGVLATEYGVDLDKVTWIPADEEPVEAFQRDAPKNAESRLNEFGPVAKSSLKSQNLDQLDQN